MPNYLRISFSQGSALSTKLRKFEIITFLINGTSFNSDLNMCENSKIPLKSKNFFIKEIIYNYGESKS